MNKSLNNYGGNQLLLISLDENFSVPNEIINGVNALNCGLIYQSDIEITSSVEIFKAEDGRIYGFDQEFEAKTSGVLMETSKLIADYLAFKTRYNYQLEIKYQGIKAAKHQEIFKIVKVVPQMKFSSPGGIKAMKYESIAVVNPQNITFNENNLNAIKAALNANIYASGPVTIPAYNEHIIIETGI